MEIEKEELEKILLEFYNYVLDECNGNLHEYQIYDYVETLENAKYPDGKPGEYGEDGQC